MANSPDHYIERFSKLTHSPRGPQAPSDELYRELLDRIPVSDRPVIGQGASGHTRRKWSIAASIALITGIGLAIAGVYSYRNESLPDAAPEPTIVTPSAVTVQTLEFDQTPLSEIIGTLAETYHVEIVIVSPELVDYCMTATFSTDESLMEILDALAEVGGFCVEQTGDSFSIHR